TGWITAPRSPRAAVCDREELEPAALDLDPWPTLRAAGVGADLRGHCVRPWSRRERSRRRLSWSSFQSEVKYGSPGERRPEEAASRVAGPQGRPEKAGRFSPKDGVARLCSDYL